MIVNVSNTVVSRKVVGRWPVVVVVNRDVPSTRSTRDSNSKSKLCF